MTLPPDVLKGFKVEAADYLAQIREEIAAADGDTDSPALIASVREKLDVVSGSAALLEMEEVMSLTESVMDHLESYSTDQESTTLIQEVEDVITQVESLLGVQPTAEPTPPVEEPSPPPPADMPDLPPELLAIFQSEAQEHHRTIQEGVDHLESNCEDDTTLRDVRRAAHTLKGASASVGFKRLAEMAHIMEDVLDGVIDGGARLTADQHHLLNDIAYAIEDFIAPTGTVDREGLTASIKERAEALAAAEPSTPKAMPERPTDSPASTEPTPAGEAMVRLPLSTIDTLIDHVGEVIINHGALGEQMGTLRLLLSDFDTTAQRLQRLANELDNRIERESLNLVTSNDMYASGADSAFDTIELDRYSALYQLARELEEVATDTQDINKRLDLLSDDLGGLLTRERRLTGDIQEGLINTKLMTFHEIVPRLMRVVQHTGQELDRPVELSVTGEDTRVDKAILDALLEPLTHLLRNAIDHGIEDDRQAAGKPQRGTIRLDVTRDRGRILLTLSDDGRGIDVEGVRQQALRLGVIQPDEQLTEQQTIDLIFTDGFSTASTITHTSGRGVGMNIVQRSVRAMQGNIRVNTSPGRGTTFTISVPVSLAIIRALFCMSQGIQYAIPLDQIGSVLRLGPEVLATVTDDGVLGLDDKRYAIVDLGSFTDPDNIYGVGVGQGERRYGLVVDLGEREAAVLVDGLMGIRDAVVKSLGNHLRRVHGVSGATISGDGQVSLILDLFEIASGRAETDGRYIRQMGEQPQVDAMHVLIVDDSPSVRRVVSAFLEGQGWQTTTARDGIDALEKLATAQPDVALVDIEMPRMNGYELLSEIKEDARWALMPVVMLTSRSAPKHRRRAENLGVDGYLVKPYREDELVDMLSTVVSRRRT